MPVTLVVSGGQTGADQGALEAATRYGIKTGGYAPAGFKTEDGPNAALLRDTYGLVECQSESYRDRDKANVDMLGKDGGKGLLVAFRYRVPMTGRGTDSTINYAVTGVHEMPAQQWDDGTPISIFTARNDNMVIVLWDVEGSDLGVARGGELLYEALWRINPTTMLVSGPCESTAPGTAATVCSVIVQALRRAGYVMP